MSGAVKSGLPSVLEAVRPHEQAVEDEAEQLDLLGMRTLASDAAVERKPGPGRPLGSRNKRTEAWAHYLLARYASPLEVLAQIATSSVEDLHVRLGCTRLEALQEKRLAALGLLPYVHQRQPIAVDLNTRQVVNLMIVEGSPAPSDSLAVEIIGVVENQEFSEGEDGPV